jgi:hypothetical protein
VNGRGRRWRSIGWGGCGGGWLDAFIEDYFSCAGGIERHRLTGMADTMGRPDETGFLHSKE